jgi:hypothetical protein
MEPVVISYFPGAGGFRFIHHLLGESFDQKPQDNYHQVHRVNDHLIHHNPANQYRYPTLSDHGEIDNSIPIAYTHSVNSDLIRKTYPKRKIIKIKSSLTDALVRYWNVAGKDRWQQEIVRLGGNTMLNSVMLFHLNYYTQTGVDWSADQLIDIETDSDKFSVFMRDQLSQHRLSDTHSHLKNWQITVQHSMDF